jgi:pimeloyl-ACP methyl ester carboxylesterase
MAGQWTQEQVRVGETELCVLKGGQGKPLLYLHGELGFEGWCEWHGALAQQRTLVIPLHPGFGKSQAADWIMDIRDLAAFYARFIREQKVAPADVIGFSLGGWIAAEMAVANSTQLHKMILVGAAGLRPPRGEIMDMYTVTARRFLGRNVHDPAHTPEFGTLYGSGPEMTAQQGAAQWEAWEDARAATARIAWKPYMFTQSMPHLLSNVAGLPTLLIWGKQDDVMPLSAGQLYHEKIAGSRLLTFEGCGHMPMIEKPAEFIRAVEDFLR